MVQPGQIRLSEASDEELMALVASGERSALGELARRYGPKAWRVATRWTGDVGASQDLVQESFVRVMLAANRWEARSRFSTWYFRILYNLCIDHKRRSMHDWQDLDPDTFAVDADPDRPLMQEQVALRVQQALASLPEKYRMAIVLRHYECLSLGDIGEILGVSAKAVERILAKARDRLQEDLPRRGPFG